MNKWSMCNSVKVCDNSGFTIPSILPSLIVNLSCGNFNILHMEKVSNFLEVIFFLKGKSVIVKSLTLFSTYKFFLLFNLKS